MVMYLQTGRWTSVSNDSEENFESNKQTFLFTSTEEGALVFSPVDSDGQQAAHRRHHGDADHGVKHVVQLPEEVVFHYQLLVVEEVNDDGLPGVGHTHQHVGHRQAGRTKPVSFSLDQCSCSPDSRCHPASCGGSEVISLHHFRVFYTFTGLSWVGYASCVCSLSH